MTHTEYIELTELLRKLTGDADLLREGRVYVSVDDHGEIQITTRAECDQTKHSKPIKGELLTRTQNNVSRAVEIMAKCVDGWVAYNQDRADNKLTVTDQDRALYEGMTGFMSATDRPIKNVSGVYASLRSRCRSWMDQATEWFPDLNAVKESNQKSKRLPTRTIDRTKMENLFIGKFKNKEKNDLPSKFEMFYNALASVSYTPTDYARIAYQVQHSSNVLARYKPNQMTFAGFLRVFFDACGVDVPKDTSPSRYKDKTQATDYSAYL